MAAGPFNNGVLTHENSRYPILCRPGFEDAATVAANRDANIGPAFHINVGGARNWSIPFSPLVLIVPYFSKYAVPGQKGSQNILVGLPAEDPDIFAIFNDWLFHGNDVQRLTQIDPERWIDFILLVEKFGLHELALDATVVLIDTIQLYPPHSEYCAWCMKKLETCYIRAFQKRAGFGVRFIMVHFLSVYFRFTTRNKSSQAFLNTAFESDYFRWGPILNIQPNFTSAEETLTQARLAVGRHLLPLIFVGPGVELNNETALLLWEGILVSDNAERSQQLQRVAHEIRGYLNIVPIQG